MGLNYKFSVFVLIAVWQSACEQNDKRAAEYLAPQSLVKFSPYMPSQERRWMTEADAQVAKKFHYMIEVSKFSDQQVSEEQKQAAENLYQATLENAVAKGWFSFEKAKQDGFMRDKFHDANHFINYEFLLDNKQLDPSAPEFLMFYELNGEKVLVGVMFMLLDFNAHGAQIGGNDTIWHYHHYSKPACLPTIAPEEITKNAEKCEGGYLLEKSPEMMHLWFIDHPEGRFATSMSIDNNLILNNKLIKEQTDLVKSNSH